MSEIQKTRPARTSTVLAAVVGLAVVIMLLQQATIPRDPALVTIAGFLCLALCLRLVETTPSVGETFVVGLLTLPIALGFIGGLFWTSLVLVGAQFPVPTDADVSIAILLVGGNLGIVLGGTLAVFGLVLGFRNVLAAEPLSRYTKLSVAAALVPLLVGLLVFVRVALAGDQRAGESLFGEAVGLITAVLLNPTASHLHLGPFLFLLTVTLGTVYVFLGKAPVAELLDREDGMASVRSVERIRRWLYIAVTVSAVLMVAAVVLEVRRSPAQLRSELGPTLFEAIQLVTTAGWLRYLLFGVIAASAGWLFLDHLLGETSDWSDSVGSQWAGPLLAGTLLTVLAWITAEAVFDRILHETTVQLPDVLAAEFQDSVLPVVDVYGEPAVVVLLTGTLLGLTAWIGFIFRVAVYFGYLTNEGAGFSIASAGILFGTAAVSLTEPPSWLIFLGVTAALVVWDLGQFGTRLGREVGQSSTRSVEFVHAGATALVGALAVTGAIFLESRAATASFRPSPTVVLALLFLVVGLVAFSLALRESGISSSP